MLGLYLSSSVSVGFVVGGAAVAGGALDLRGHRELAGIAAAGRCGLATLGALAALGACRGRAEPAPPPPPAIEVRDAGGAVTARVVPGHPCRATVEGAELLVGGRPLVAQDGAARWTGEDAANGTTLKRDGAPVARVYARQLFDADGIPILRVLPDGSVTNRASAVVRSAAVAPTGDAVTVGTALVTGTTDLVLAAMLAAPEAPPRVRALVACHFLLGAP